MRAKFVSALAPLALLACAESAVAATMHVTKSASCGCCDGWVEHAKRAGFDVKVTVVDDMTATARRLGVPDQLRSCHTTEVDGYVVEGHVPAADVKRLLATRPKAAGLAVPGMVVGSPGMEQGGRSEPYETVIFQKDGSSKLFARH